MKHSLTQSLLINVCLVVVHQRSTSASFMQFFEPFVFLQSSLLGLYHLLTLFSERCLIVYRVHIFWEDHKILRNCHLTFDWHYLLHRKKSEVKIFANFVSFSEYMNFTIQFQQPTNHEWQSQLPWISKLSNIYLLR